jgi:hypothetical protein
MANRTSQVTIRRDDRKIIAASVDKGNVVAGPESDRLSDGKSSSGEEGWLAITKFRSILLNRERDFEKLSFMKSCSHQLNAKR